MVRTGAVVYACLVILVVLWVFVAGAMPHTTHARLGGYDLSLETLTTSSAREKGLSGRDGLGLHEGMLFVFPKDDRYGFWMKDMKFPIDILWLDAGYTIVDTVQAVQPDSYPQVYTPRVSARYVVELPAGFFVEHSLKIGNTLEILK